MEYGERLEHPPFFGPLPGISHAPRVYDLHPKFTQQAAHPPVHLLGAQVPYLDRKRRFKHLAEDAQHYPGAGEQTSPTGTNHNSPARVTIRWIGWRGGFRFVLKFMPRAIQVAPPDLDP